MRWIRDSSRLRAPQRAVRMSRSLAIPEMLRKALGAGDDVRRRRSKCPKVSCVPASLQVLSHRKRRFLPIHLLWWLIGSYGLRKHGGLCVSSDTNQRWGFGQTRPRNGTPEDDRCRGFRVTRGGTVCPDVAARGIRDPPGNTA